MMNRFRDLEVPVAVGVLLLSAFLGITGWKGQPSNGKEITGGQTVNVPIGPFIYEWQKACEEENNCTETKACAAWFAPAFNEVSDRIGAVPRTHTNGSQYRMHLPQTANQATMYVIVT